MHYRNLDTTSAFAALVTLGKDKGTREKPRPLPLTAEDVRSRQIPMAAGLTYSWAAKGVSTEVIEGLQRLAGEQELIAKYEAILNGETMNTGEHRKVLHHLLRGQTGKPVIHEGKDLGAFYQHEVDRIAAFADAVHTRRIQGSTGKAFTHVVQIGIGGSDLGPRAMYRALERWADAEHTRRMTAQFISNVDPDDAAAVCAAVPLETTLFILVSKSGATQETLANELFVTARLTKAGLDPSRHMVAVTSETSPLARNPAYLDSFYMDDFIGGRYSVTSAVGGVVLSLAFGAAAFRSFLAGAHDADMRAREPDIRKNPALLDALLGIWERNVCGYPYTAVIPYSQALSRFPAHLQQLDMESNGKQVNRNGEPVSYATGPVVFGEPGTNGQHSFFQLLHQGTDIVPIQFIGFTESQGTDDVTVDGSTSQTKLLANLAAQIVAFAHGKTDPNGNKHFPGGRPSSLIYGKRLVPETLGALLAHYENKVMFQGLVWNLNSFDQEGVQLGKLLTKQVLAQSGGAEETALDVYAGLLGIRPGP